MAKTKKYRGGQLKRRSQKGGNPCPVPNNPTPSSYWPGPSNPAPPNPLPSPECQFKHFRPLVLSQFGGKSRRLKRSRRNRSKKYKKHTRKIKK